MVLGTNHNYHGNPQPSILGVIKLQPIFWGCKNLHFFVGLLIQRVLVEAHHLGHESQNAASPWSHINPKPKTYQRPFRLGHKQTELPKKS